MILDVNDAPTLRHWAQLLDDSKIARAPRNQWLDRKRYGHIACCPVAAIAQELSQAGRGFWDSIIFHESGDINYDKTPDPRIFIMAAIADRSGIDMDKALLPRKYRIGRLDDNIAVNMLGTYLVSAYELGRVWSFKDSAQLLRDIAAELEE